MKKNLIGIRHAALLLFVFAFAHGAASGAGKTYEEQLAEACRFAGEKSWALARDAYAEAAKAAPDDDVKRWCGLWQAQAEWRAGEKGWLERQDFEKRLTAWLEPYVPDEKAGSYERGSREKDAFWMEVMKVRMETSHGVSDRGILWDTRREILDYLTSAAPSEEATGRLMAFVRELDYFRNSYASGEAAPRAKFAESLGRIANAGTLPREDRAWCALASLGLSTSEVAMRQRRNVENLCKGTRYEVVADAMIFATETQGGELSVLTDSSAANQEAWSGGFQGLLARAKQLRAKLPEKPDEHVFLSASESLDHLIMDWEFPYLIVDLLPSIGMADCAQFSVGTARVRNIKAELYTYDFAAFRALREVEGQAKDLHGADLFEQQRKVPGVRLVDSMPLFAKSAGNEFAWRSAVFHFEQKLAPGFYMLVLSGEHGEGERRVVSSDFVVSDVRVATLISSGDELYMHVLGKKDGAPVAGAEVQVASFAYRWMHEQNKGAQIGQTWAGHTDMNGRFNMPVIDKERNGNFTAIVANGHPVIAPGAQMQAMWWLPDEQGEKIVADLFLDRPLYRPGETVHWKLIARERKDERFAVCRQPARACLQNAGTFKHLQCRVMRHDIRKSNED